ncbi:unnamed protein product, partial [Phaeothamnion confervicola]
VAELLVREGQRVAAGQPLIRIETAAVTASESWMASQLIDLEAERSRLLAEQANASDMAAPPDFALLIGTRADEARLALEQQRAARAIRARSLDAKKAELVQKIRILTEQASGYEDQQSWTGEQIKLLSLELDGVRGLAAKGYTSQNRVRSLESTLAGQRATEAGLRSAHAQARAQAQEVRLELASLALAEQERISTRLHEIDNALGEVRPKYGSARDALEQTIVRASVNGTVLGLKVAGAHDVVGPGADLMQIVPEGRRVVAEVAISPGDADDIHVGMKTEVKLTGFPASSLPPLAGVVTRVSADRIVDGEGEEGFVAEVAIDATSRAIVTRRYGASAIKPGLPVSVIIPTRERRGIDYVIDPLRRILWKSFREE